MRRDSFMDHRFPREVILLAVRCYCRFPLSYQDVADLLAERRIVVDCATVLRWVQKSGPEIARRAYNHRLLNSPEGQLCGQGSRLLLCHRESLLSRVFDTIFSLSQTIKRSETYLCP